MPHCGIGRQPVEQIGGCAGGIAAQIDCRGRDHQRRPPVHQQSFAGEPGARLQQFLPGHFGVTAMRFLQPGDDAGHRDRAGAMQVAVVLDARPGKDVGGRAMPGQRIIFDPQALRRAHAVIDHLDLVVGRAVEHHRAAAADPVHPGFDHAQRKRGRNHRIDAIAAGGQYLGADFRGYTRLRCNDAALRGDGGFGDVLAVGKLVGGHVCYRSLGRFFGRFLKADTQATFAGNIKGASCRVTGLASLIPTPPAAMRCGLREGRGMPTNGTNIKAGLKTGTQGRR